MRLVENWRRVHTWLSVQIAGIGIVVQGALIALPERIEQHVPEWVLTAAAILSFVGIIAGRLIDQSKKDDGAQKP